MSGTNPTEVSNEITAFPPHLAAQLEANRAEMEGFITDWQQLPDPESFYVEHGGSD